MDDSDHNACCDARAWSVGESAHDGRHERGVVFQEGRSGKERNLDEREKRADGAHESHDYQLSCAPDAAGRSRLGIADVCVRGHVRPSFCEEARVRICFPR